MNSINEIISAKAADDNIALIRESLYIYQRKNHVDRLCSIQNEWPSTLSYTHFWGQRSQPFDYLLGLVAKGVYKNNWTFIHGIERLNHEQLKTLGIDSSILRDRFTGFESIICRYHDWYIISFAGTNDFIDLYADIRQALGFYEPQYFQAVTLANILYRVSKGKMLCTGHSLGGGLATLAAITCGCPSITFSPAGISVNTIKRLGLDYNHVEKNAKNGLSRFYVVQYDWLDFLQSFTPSPPALGNKILLNYYESELVNHENVIPHFLSRNVIAHSINKILNMMCFFAPWSKENKTFLNETVDVISEIDLTRADNFYLANWQETCERCIKQNKLDEFAQLIKLENKSVKIDELVSCAILAHDSQFMAILFESTYASEIKHTHLENGRSYLHLAAQSGRLAQIQILLNNGFSINATDDWGNTPLHDALGSHALFAAEYLLCRGADWQIRNHQDNNCYDIFIHHSSDRHLLSLQGKAVCDNLLQLMK